MELEEAIKECYEIIGNFKSVTTDFTKDIFPKKAEAIETVLQALEKKDKEIQELKAANIMQEYRINEMDIPKKKIEDFIAKKAYCTYSASHKVVDVEDLQELLKEEN